MTKLNKRARMNEKLVVEEALPAAKAIAALKQFKGPKFDQTVNVVMHLGVDVKQADQMIRGSVSLPKGIGKAKRVVAFCQPDVAREAMAAGAIKAGGEDLVSEIEGGFFDFDVAVTSPDMMRVISKLGRVLGPKGLMPSPKNGTVTTEVVRAVQEFAAGKLEYRTDKGGNIHGVIGKMSFPNPDLLENLEFFVQTIEKAKPSSLRGVYVKKICLSGTMTPGVQVYYETAEAATA